uniref:Dynein light chain Tctex-type 1 n=1 Tax=Ficedula albicollis TaxID=59894 RepID=A0A803W3G3_FICAL
AVTLSSSRDVTARHKSEAARGAKVSFAVDEVSSIIKEAIEGAIGGNAYQHSRVNQWTTSVVEQTLSQLTKLGKPFKYIGELSFPFSLKAGTVKCNNSKGWGKILGRTLSTNCSQACMSACLLMYVDVCAKLSRNGAKC